LEKNNEIIFLFYFTKGGCESNLELLSGLVSSLVVPFRGIIYSNEEISPEIEKTYSRLGFQFLQASDLFPHLTATLGPDDNYVFYFQDISLIPILKNQYKNSKLIYEVHILQQEILKRFKIGSAYAKINEVREVVFKNDYIMAETINLKRATMQESQILPLLDLIVSNSANTTLSLSEIVPKVAILETELTCDLFPINIRKQIYKSSTFLFLNVPTIYKGFHSLLCPSDFQINVYGSREPYMSNFNHKKLAQFGITFKGWLSTKEDKLRTLDEHSFALFPSDYESRGLSLDECLRRGIICFCQKTNPGFKDQIEDLKNGFLIEFNQDWPDTIDLILKEYTESQLLSISNNASLTYQAKKSCRFDKIFNALNGTQC
jgi:glycosyltransferase involved in cell wall biosynthesis